MTCKLRIDIPNGLIDVEGSEELVAEVYKDFRGSFIKTQLEKSLEKGLPANDLLPDNTQPAPDNKKKSAAKPKTKKPTASRSYSLNKELNLYSEGSNPGLKEFVGKYDNKNNFAKNLLFIHYLKSVKELEQISVNDLYTCYKHVEAKIPNIEQSLRDCASRKGWLDTSSTGDIKITVAGENAITHELIIKDGE